MGNQRTAIEFTLETTVRSLMEQLKQMSPEADLSEIFRTIRAYVPRSKGCTAWVLDTEVQTLVEQEIPGKGFIYVNQDAPTPQA